MYTMSTTSLEWLSVISQVMYRPSTDLDGIPGAKSLVVCLTGYQRQDRDDIMVGAFPSIFLSVYPTYLQFIISGFILTKVHLP